MAPSEVTEQGSVITRFWFASMVFWPAVFIAARASDSWLLAVVIGSIFTLATLAVTWRVTFGNWACLAAVRKTGDGR